MRKKIYDQMATQTKGKKKEHIMVNVMLLDFHVSSFFLFIVLTQKRKEKKEHIMQIEKRKRKRKHAKLMHEHMQ